MIERERLQELINQGATIYEAKYGKVNPVSLKNKIRFVSEKYPVIAFEPRPNEKYKHYKYFDKLYETQYEAEWVAKMHTQRPEYFDPPTWEEFEKDPKFSFWVNKLDGLGGLYSIEKTTDVVFDEYENEVEKQYLDIYATLIENHKTGSGYFYRRDYTKDNYIKACEYARFLFLGKENENE